MTKYLEASFRSLLDSFAAGSDVPGSGSAAAAGAAIAASLVVTVAKLTIKKAEQGTDLEKERYGPFQCRAQEIQNQAEKLQQKLLNLVQSDAENFASVVAQRKARDDERDPARRKALDDDCQQKLRCAAEGPVEVAVISAAIADLAMELVERGFQSASGDSGVAAMLAVGAVLGASCVTSLNASALRIDREWIAKQCALCLALRRRMEHTQARALLLSEHQLFAGS